MNNRTRYYLDLLSESQQRLVKAEAQEAGTISEDILHQFSSLIDQLTEHRDTAYESGQDLLALIGTHHPQLMPVIDRGVEQAHHCKEQSLSSLLPVPPG